MSAPPLEEASVGPRHVLIGLVDEILTDAVATPDSWQQTQVHTAVSSRTVALLGVYKYTVCLILMSVS